MAAEKIDLEGIGKPSAGRYIAKQKVQFSRKYRKYSSLAISGDSSCPLGH